MKVETIARPVTRLNSKNKHDFDRNNRVILYYIGFNVNTIINLVTKESTFPRDSFLMTKSH